MEMLHEGSEKSFFLLRKKFFFLEWILRNSNKAFCPHFKQWFGAAIGGGQGEDKKQTYILGFHLINALKLKKKDLKSILFFLLEYFLLFGNYAILED